MTELEMNLSQMVADREKQIEIDAEHIRALQKQNGELTDKIRKLEAYNEKLLDGDIEKHNKIVELEAQIEEMKNCQNCKHYTSFNGACMEYGYFSYECNKKDWEIKEK